MIKIRDKYLVNTLLKLKNNFCPSFPWTFTQTERENAKKDKNDDKTLYFWSNPFLPAKTIFHNCWLWWLRHLEGLITESLDSHLSLDWERRMEDQKTENIFFLEPSFLLFSLSCSATLPLFSPAHLQSPGSLYRWLKSLSRYLMALTRVYIDTFMICSSVEFWYGYDLILYYLQQCLISVDGKSFSLLISACDIKHRT